MAGGPRVCVMYGTQTGNSRGIATQLGEVLVASGFDAPVASLDQFKKVRARADASRFRRLLCLTSAPPLSPPLLCST